jgi:hypothetical protein
MQGDAVDGGTGLLGGVELLEEVRTVLRTGNDGLLRVDAGIQEFRRKFPIWEETLKHACEGQSCTRIHGALEVHILICNGIIKEIELINVS